MSVVEPYEIGRSELESHWIPFTDNKSFKEEPRLFTRAEGVHLWNQHGERLLDGSSGLFTAAAGHCRPEITKAVTEQLQTLDYVPSFYRGHPGAFELANKLCALLPEPMNHVFFCNSGSESVDSALKIALQYHHCRGEGNRTMMVSRDRAYHGVNLGGTSLSGMAKNRHGFNSLLPGVVHMRSTWDEAQVFSRGRPLHRGVELADDLLRAVQTYGGNNIAACFIEPIAGSTGVLVPPEGYLERIREICTEHGILMVMDEVLTGFGRSGAAFAGQAFGVEPDIMTMAKALTNGTQPMGAVGVKDEIYHTVVNAYPNDVVELAHGYTYSAHPVACAAAIATLDIYEQENLFQRAAEMSDYFQEAIFSLQNLASVTDIRGYGMLAGLDVKPGKNPGERGHLLQKKLFDAGLHVKTTGDAAIVAPPLVTEKEQIDEMCEILKSVLINF